MGVLRPISHNQTLQSFSAIPKSLDLRTTYRSRFDFVSLKCFCNNFFLFLNSFDKIMKVVNGLVSSRFVLN